MRFVLTQLGHINPLQTFVDYLEGMNPYRIALQEEWALLMDF